MVLALRRDADGRGCRRVGSRSAAAPAGRLRIEPVAGQDHVTKRTSLRPGGVARLVGKRVTEVLAQGSLPGLAKKPSKSRITAITKVHHYISSDQSVEVQWDHDG